MKRTRLGLVLVLVPALTLLTGAWLMGHNTSTVITAPPDAQWQPQPESTQVSARALKPETIARLVAEADPERADFRHFIHTLPASLADLPPPAPVNLTAQGDLLVDAQLRQLFEHYLSALGEETLPQVLVRIKYALAQQLTGKALEQGMALLEAYVQYRNQQGVIRADYEQRAAGAFSPDTILAMKQAERQARQLYFPDAQSQALFGDQDQIEDAMLERLAINTNHALSQEERQQQLQAVQARLVERLDAHAQQPVQQILDQDRQLLADAAAPEDLTHSRTQRFGPDVAQRLAARDQARAHWQARVASYRISLLPLLANKPVDHQLIADLRHYHFAGPELARIAALDRLELAF